MSNRARPPPGKPVNATAVTAGSATRARPAASPCTRVSTPSAAPASVRAAVRISAVRTENPGCPGCALTTTGQPAARALAVSPPATEKANGKLDAAKTATGPSGTSMRRRSVCGGTACGSGPSSVASQNAPSRRTSANRSNCAAVRASSPVRRGRPSAVSASASATSSSEWSRSAWPRAASSAARSGKASPPSHGAARPAREHTSRIRSGVVSAISGPIAAPVRGSIARLIGHLLRSRGSATVSRPARVRPLRRPAVAARPANCPNSTSRAG